MYKAVLFAPDGEWTTDHKRDTVEEVYEALADQGSRWYFYPLHAVIRDRGALTTHTQRIVSAGVPFMEITGRTIKTAGRIIAETPDEELEIWL